METTHRTKSRALRPHEADAFGGSDVSLAQLLFERRGWTPQFLTQLNDPSHPPLKDMDRLVHVLAGIRERGEQLVIMPDYDMDGISAGTLGFAGFAELGFNVRLYVPDYKDGHDIVPKAVDKLKAAFPAATAVITCDAGVNSVEGIARGKALGLTMLVTDHHTQTTTDNPADVIVDPARIDEAYPNEGICGAMVLWQVLEAFAEAHVPAKRREIQLLRLFAGLGTVSDVMPLVYENRDAVRDSLAIARMLCVPIPSADTATVYDPEDSVLMQILRAGDHHKVYVSAFEGFAIAMKAFREHGPLVQATDEKGVDLVDEEGNPSMVRSGGPLRSAADLTEEFYGFYLAPTFNAVRRMSGSMDNAFGVFFEKDPQAKWDCAIRLIEDNLRRRESSKNLLKELKESEAAGDQPLAPWVWTTDAAGGMLGLLAGQLASELQIPLAVVNVKEGGQIGGSMRAPTWYAIIDRLGGVHGFDVQGHQQACGVKLKNMAHAAHFAQVLEQEVEEARQLAVLEGTELGHIEPDLLIGDVENADAGLNQTEDFVELGLAVAGIGPFGHRFEAPRIELVMDLSTCSISSIGSNNQHLRITSKGGLKLFWWNEADRVMELRERASSWDADQRLLRVMAKLRVNEFQDILTPMFSVESMLPIPQSQEDAL